MRRIALALMTILLCAPAVHAQQKSSSAFDGLWQGVCNPPDKETLGPSPTMDILQRDANGLTQYSLTFDKRTSCDVPSLVMKIQFKLEAQDSLKAKGAQEWNLVPIKIERRTLNVAAAIQASKSKDCGRERWDTQKYVDCGKHEPYKAFLSGQKMKLLLQVDKGKLRYRDIREEDLEEGAAEESFMPIAKLPFNLDAK